MCYFAQHCCFNTKKFVTIEVIMERQNSSKDQWTDQFSLSATFCSLWNALTWSRDYYKTKSTHKRYKKIPWFRLADSYKNPCKRNINRSDFDFLNRYWKTHCTSEKRLILLLKSCLYELLLIIMWFALEGKST